MSGNNLQVLPKETFIRAALFDLQKVYLRNCQIGQIDDRALRGLSNVVDLDLSNNLLTSIPSSIFEDVPNLRNLSLAYNPIQKVDSSTFRFVTSLTKLDLSHCKIAVIATRAFEGIEFLELLRLNGNKLSEVKLETVDALSGLHNIELHDNPWYCDCSLRTLKIWLTEKKIPYSIEPICSGGPTRILNKSFNQLHADDFACKPEMKIKPDSRYIESASGDNATIICKVESIPKATISWKWNNRLLLNNTAFSPNQRIIIHETGNFECKSILTLTNVQESDSSQFYCVAENQAGIAEANFTLRVVHQLAGFAIFGTGQMAVISLALIVLIFSILILIAYLLFRIRKMPVIREIKHSNVDDLPNGTIHSQNDNKSLNIEPSLNIKKTYPSVTSTMYSRMGTQTLPRITGLTYATAFDDHQADNSRRIYRAETSNPDLIADTRYQDSDALQKATGEYIRGVNDIFYPSSLWNQKDIQSIFAEGSNYGSSINGGIIDFRDTNDKTPIIEEVSFYNNLHDAAIHQRIPKNCEFPTTSSPAESPCSIPTSTLSHPNAKTIRVWQKGVQVLPPVTALKRVLNRSSPDEGYQEGCGTDV
ncbi:hypothetical protein PGB90_005510 [Kerria lacca]